MKPLFIPLKTEYFNAFLTGQKNEELRLYGTEISGGKMANSTCSHCVITWLSKHVYQCWGCLTKFTTEISGGKDD